MFAKMLLNTSCTLLSVSQCKSKLHPLRSCETSAPLLDPLLVNSCIEDILWLELLDKLLEA